MNVNSTQQSQTASPFDVPAAPSNALGKDQFVKLLMAQMANQNPLNPQDSSAFVAQLAQFASLEQQQTANSTLESLLMSQTSAAQLNAASLVGRIAEFSTATVDLSAGSKAPLQCHLDSPAASLTVTIQSADGKTVRTLQLGAQPAGDVQLEWDGRDDAGQPLAAGTYSVQMAAADVDGHSVTVEQRLSAPIDGVSFEHGYPELLAGTHRLRLADIISVHSASPSPSPQ